MESLPSAVVWFLSCMCHVRLSGLKVYVARLEDLGVKSMALAPLYLSR
jgi:hypothetical protein